MLILSPLMRTNTTYKRHNRSMYTDITFRYVAIVNNALSFRGLRRMRVVELRVASCELQLRVAVASCELRVASCSCELRVAVASCELQTDKIKIFLIRLVRVR